MLFGKDVVDAEILGVRSGRETRGHRFHAPKPLNLTSPAAYVQTLKRGFVLVDIEERRETIRQGALSAAQNAGGVAAIDPALLDEVTALVEWPVPIAGKFEERFLTLPAEVPVATMQDHQRYFPVRDAQGKLLATFIAVANIASKDPEKVRAGNERVIRPRLADAAFFWETDRKQTLASRRDALKNVTFQAQLGSYFDKVERIKGLSSLITQSLGTSAQDAFAAQHAAELCKCDLLSLLVGEFPELQGTMGKYYAQHDGESGDVALALEEHYLPRFAGDALPTTLSGTVVAIADKIDTVVGIFAIGQKPSGTKDPFALRRAALGVLRLMLEQHQDLNLVDLIRAALRQLPSALQNEQTVTDVYDYMMERLRAYYLEGAASAAITTEMFDAVLANRPSHPLDFDARLKALSEFVALPDASALAAANKRIANILRKSNVTATHAFSAALAEQNEERSLHEAIEGLRSSVERSLDERNYSAALIRLASLRPAVDAFFDKVMVMADNPTIRDNRLALLGALRGLFSRTADLSRLPG
jgi:glycyl-tRNA synthetase beta chain